MTQRPLHSTNGGAQPRAGRRDPHDGRVGTTWSRVRRNRGSGMTASLRKLYFFRVAFSVTWVALVSFVGPSAASGSSLSILAGLLLVIYPMSDAIATIVDLRSDATGQSKVPQRINATTSTATAVAVTTGMLANLATAMDVFAIWASVSGAIQTLVGAQRLGRLDGQWPMIISGAGSIFAGTTFLGWAGSSSTALHALVQYSIGGAVWYLLTASWCARREIRCRVDEPRWARRHEL